MAKLVFACSYKLQIISTVDRKISEKVHKRLLNERWHLSGILSGFDMLFILVVSSTLHFSGYGLSEFQNSQTMAIPHSHRNQVFASIYVN
jgi:hypothetical protein